MANGKDSSTLISRLAGMRTFRLQLALLVAVYTVFIYGALYLQIERQLKAQLRAQGASYFELVVNTRAWNSEHGGVWLMKDAGAETNPYLVEIGIPADIEAASGAELTLRNPAAMMGEISELTEAGSGVSFHLPSNDPLNPDNTPDEWERGALNQFAEGTLEYAETFERDGPEPTYRYMAPLEVDTTCLGCHWEEGYELGSVRGGVSIAIPMDEVEAQLQQTRMTLGAFALVTLGLAIGASQLFVNRLERKLDDASEQISEMAVTDELTGLPNRRAALERLGEEFSRAKRTLDPLSVIAVDLDHFKRINDRHGHAVGDAVLREVASRMGDSVREYDIAGRVGGEEFLIVSPATGLEAARSVAERVLGGLRAEPINVGDLVLTVTASAGVATIHSTDERSDVLLVRADDALYAAKDAGRDTVRTQNQL